MALKTDNEGYPVLLFIGKLDQQGYIEGERYVRTLKYDREGNLAKDHWK